MNTDTLETLRAERDALRAACERLRGEAAEQTNEKVRAIGLYGLESIKTARLLRAAQSLHRAWRRENAFGDDAVEQWAAADSRCDALRAEVERLKAERDTARRDIETLMQALAALAGAKGGEG